MHLEAKRLPNLGPLAVHSLKSLERAQGSTSAAELTERDKAAGSATDPLVFVHGFAQNSQCLGPFGASLAGQHQLLAVDAPGHGASSEYGDADLWECSELLHRSIGVGAYLGYSMGARMCLHVAISHPESVTSLVLISGTAGIESDGTRAERRHRDFELAGEIDRMGIAEFLDQWLKQPLFASLPPSMAFATERSRNIASGLSASLRSAGTGSMDPLWSRLGELDMPVLVISGELDENYTTLAERMVREIGSNAQLEVVADAGHSVHLEQPDATAELIDHFLAEIQPAPRNSPTDNNTA